MTVVSPFDDLDTMAGQGTVGLELSDHLREEGVTPDAFVVNCSGGGLASGTIEAMETAFPGIEKFIVEPFGYDKMARSLKSGQACSNPEVPVTVMDGIGGPVAGKLPVEALLRHRITGLTVTDEEALSAVAAAFQSLKLVIEPGGAASLAAVLAQKAEFQGKTVALVASGGNVDPQVYVSALEKYSK